MAFNHADRVKETSTTNGTGDYTLAGAVAGFQSFAAIGDQNLCYYSANDGTNWEQGIGKYVASGTTLQRVEIKSSSNANAAVNWAGGTTKTIFVTPLAGTYPELGSGLVLPTNPSPGMEYVHLLSGAKLTYLSDGVNSLWAELGPEGTQQMADLWKILAADDTGGQNVTTVQPWFPTAGGVLVEANRTYGFRGFLHATRAAGTAAHTTSALFGGTATVSKIKGAYLCASGDVATLNNLQHTLIDVATALGVKASSTSATEVLALWAMGVIRFTTAGTLIPQFQYVTNAPGGAPTIKDGTHFMMWPLAKDTDTFQGTWA